MPTTALILPGIGNSGPDHWQSRWAARDAGFERIQQRDWDHPARADWQAVLDAGVVRIGKGVVLVAHSLACLLVAHWACGTQHRVKGALLVAPPDPDGPAFPKEATGFSPLPMQRLPFPSIVVASTDDPYGSIAFAQSAAGAWGSRFVSVGPAGHINAASGLGDWDAGFVLFEQLAA